MLSGAQDSLQSQSLFDPQRLVQNPSSQPVPGVLHSAEDEHLRAGLEQATIGFPM
jgi:hypothetical protein